MTKTTRMLILAAALTLLLALVATATAAPPECKKKDLDCTTTTTTTTTTVVPESLGVGLSCKDYATLNPGSVKPLTWDVDEFGTLPDFELTWTSGKVAPCIDFLSEKPGEIKVTVTPVVPVPKRSSVLAIVVKDSHPGDHCGAAEGEEGSALNINLKKEATGTIDDIPATTVNACGTPFAEAELDDNGVVIPFYGQNVETPDPLAIMFLITGKPGITANITLHFKP